MAEARCLSRLKALVEPGFHGKLTHYIQHVLLKQYTPLGCYLWSPHVYTILWILTFSLHYFSSSLPTSPPTPPNSWALWSSFSFTTWLKAWTPWSRIALGRRWQSQMDCNLAGPLPTKLIPGMERMKATTKLARYVQVLQQYLEALPYPSSVFANCGVHIFYDFKTSKVTAPQDAHWR